jgi:hypothetical protein
MVAFIGYSSVSHLSERGRPPHDEVNGAIRAADFDRIWANMRQGWIIPG